MNWISKKRLNSVLGLNFTVGRLSVCQAARTKGAIEVVKTASADLSLDILHPEAERVGHEIKRHLDAAGFRERHCVVAIPADWIMSQHSKVPDLSPEDLASLLQLEAEKGFPCDPAQLQIARSISRAEGSSHVTQLAVRKEQIGHLAAVLTAAGLKPVSFSPGLAALPKAIAPAGEGRITVAVEPKGATLLISAGGGIVSFRTCDGVIGSEAGETALNRGVVGRELRITFEQVPAELRASLSQLELCGEESIVQPLIENLAGWAAATGLTMVRHDETDRPLGEQMAAGLALHWLETDVPSLEFLPPRPSRWAGWLARYDSKRLALAGFVLGGVAVLALGAFGWQEYRRWSLRSEWGAMRAQVTDLAAIQSLIHDYRPWYDTSFHSLSILRSVTESFPDNGSVTAKSFEIHGLSGVSVTGTARDNSALLHTLDQLRKTKEIQDLKIEQIRGKAPLQFTLSFRWNNNSGS